MAKCGSLAQTTADANAGMPDLGPEAHHIQHTALTEMCVCFASKLLPDLNNNLAQVTAGSKANASSQGQDPRQK